MRAQLQAWEAERAGRVSVRRKALADLSEQPAAAQAGPAATATATATATDATTDAATATATYADADADRDADADADTAHVAARAASAAGEAAAAQRLILTGLQVSSRDRAQQAAAQQQQAAAAAVEADAAWSKEQSRLAAVRQQAEAIRGNVRGWGWAR